VSAACDPKVLDGLAAVLEAVLRDELARHEALRQCLERKRQAIRGADLQAIEAICRREQGLLERLTQFEDQRRQIIGRLSGLVRPGAPPLTLRELCPHLQEDRRRALEALGPGLAAAAAAVGRESSILRSAAEALSGHLSRLMNSVRSSVDRTRVYGRQGRLAEARLPVSVDVRS
jgi:hypothetical protein